MKKWLLVLFSCFAIPGLASHIVGGEFELLHLTGNQYRMNMILYFDKINGSPAAKDYYADVNFFAMRDSTFLLQSRLYLSDSSVVQYTQPQCNHGEIRTEKYIYTAIITLSPEIFSDSMGYYATWQRCCRNYNNIVNIYSEDPNGSAFTGKYAGQTFFIQFPAVVKNGQPFYNSSPHLFPPLSDFGIPGAPYYVNFGGVDDDGDSLVYSMITPLSTTTRDALPVESPGPYPDVIWRPGYSINRITGGNPDMKISTDGLLTVTPASVVGLYVFAVKVEQYRDHEKIGESRRDFQMLVTDLQLGHPPVILGKKLTDASFTYKDYMSVNFSNTVPDDQRCIQVNVSDLDSSVPPANSEFVGIRVIPLNFDKNTDISGILPSVVTAILTNGSTVTFSVCFPKCPYVDGPYQIGIIAFDDQCALPLTDTLRVTVDVQPPPNSPPYFTPPSIVAQTLNEGDSASWIFTANDADLDNLTVALVTDGFVLADAGMKFTILQQQPGLLRGKLHWDAYCNLYNFTHRTGFQVKFLVDDQDLCNSDTPVPAIYNLNVLLPPVSDPIIDTDLTANPAEHGIINVDRQIDESLNFNVTGTQTCCDVITLTGNGVGFNFSDYGMKFNSVSGKLNIHSPFSWDITCTNADLKKRDQYLLQFILVDSNKCHIINNDSITVNVKVAAPDNAKPELQITNEAGVAFPNNQLSIILGQPVDLKISGSDSDFPVLDTLTLDLLTATGNVQPKGYTFHDTTAVARVGASFKWSPDCSIFQNGVYKNEYDFKFSVADNRCFNAKGDTAMVHVTVTDVASDPDKYIPSNVITPNGDGCNDYFAVAGLDPAPANSNCSYVTDPDSGSIFPADNCAGKFEIVRIINRWGEEVFESTDRNFRWYAQNESAGVYYFYIKFGSHEYKGSLSVRP